MSTPYSIFANLPDFSTLRVGCDDSSGSIYSIEWKPNDQIVWLEFYSGLIDTRPNAYNNAVELFVSDESLTYNYNGGNTPANSISIKKQRNNPFGFVRFSIDDSVGDVYGWLDRSSLISNLSIPDFGIENITVGSSGYLSSLYADYANELTWYSFYTNVKDIAGNDIQTDIALSVSGTDKTYAPLGIPVSSITINKKAGEDFATVRFSLEFSSAQGAGFVIY